MVVKQRAAGTHFSLVFLFGVGEGKPVPAAAPAITSPGSAASHSSCLCPNPPGCSQILPVYVHPTSSAVSFP